MAVGSKGGSEYYERRWSQFEFLAQKSGGDCLELTQADALVNKVRPIMDRQTARVDLTANVVKKLEEGRARLRAELSLKVVPQLVNASTDDRYFTYVDDMEFGWIRESLLTFPSK